MRTFLLLSGLAVLGCGGSSTSDPASTGGTGGSGGSGAVGGGGGVGGSVGGSSGTGATGGTGGTGGVSCTDFLDAPLPVNPVTIRIKNGKDVPIYLGGDTGTCGLSELYAISGANGPLTLHAGGCGFTCEGLQQHGDECPDACLIPPTIYIIPGGSYDQVWAGTTYQNASMPDECWFDPQFAYDSCPQRIAAPPGGYTVSAEAATQVTCLDVGLCSCAPDSLGSCQIPYGASPSGVMVQANAAFSMPATDLVEVTIQ